MGHTWKIGDKSHLAKTQKMGQKMGQTWKNGSHLAKSVTAGKIGPLAKRLPLEYYKHGHTWQKVSPTEMGLTLQNVSQLEKWVTLGKKCHGWKNGSHSAKKVYN